MKFLYVQAIVAKERLRLDGSGAVEFRHVTVDANDQEDAYTAGQRWADRFSYAPQTYIVNDYVVELPPAVDAVDPHVGSTGKLSTRDPSSTADALALSPPQPECKRCGGSGLDTYVDSAQPSGYRERACPACAPPQPRSGEGENEAETAVLLAQAEQWLDDFGGYRYGDKGLREQMEGATTLIRLLRQQLSTVEKEKQSAQDACLEWDGICKALRQQLAEALKRADMWVAVARDVGTRTDKAEAQIAALTNQFWDVVRAGFDIEPRAFFEKEAPKNGFGSPLAMAAHHMWKRDPKVEALTEDRTRLQAERDSLCKQFDKDNAKLRSLLEDAERRLSTLSEATKTVAQEMREFVLPGRIKLFSDQRIDKWADRLQALGECERRLQQAQPAYASLLAQLESTYREMGTVGSVLGRKATLTTDDWIRGNHSRLNGDFVYNGLDRVDNTVGYVLENVVPCCRQCNTAKNTQTISEFRSWLGRVITRDASLADRAS